MPRVERNTHWARLLWMASHVMGLARYVTCLRSLSFTGADFSWPFLRLALVVGLEDRPVAAAANSRRQLSPTSFDFS